MEPHKAYAIKQERCEAACWSCLGADNLRNMHQAYQFNGKDEIYSDMLAYCFSLQIEKHNPESNFICAICVVRLRQAFKFKTQIENTRRTFENPIVIKENICSDEDDFPQDDEWLVEFEKSEDTAVSNNRERNLTSRALPKLISYPKVKAKKKSENETKEEPEQAKEAKTVDPVPQNADSFHQLDKEEEMKQLAEYKKAHGRVRYRRWLKKLLPYELDGTELQCYICKEIFPIHKCLKMHMPVHFPNHVCETCGKGCATKPQLLQHRNSHKPQEPCPICHKLFKAANLKPHIRRAHEGHRPHRCEKCNLKFLSYYSRNKHMIKVHGQEDKRYFCKVCPKRFSCSQSLSIHTNRIHLQIRKHSCTDCDAKFVKKSELLAHMVKHGYEKLFECEYCHKKYAARKTLKEHLKIHLGIKNFTCDICNRSFTQKCTLNGHMAVHKKELRLN